MQKHHYDINIELLKNHAKYFRNALVMASIGEYSEYNYLETILEDAIKNKSEIITDAKSIKNKYNEIKGIKVDGYHYNYHQEKKKR